VYAQILAEEQRRNSVLRGKEEASRLLREHRLSTSKFFKPEVWDLGAAAI
jgi:hypothetical protein